jgi:RHS repeat-associated protein
VRRRASCSNREKCRQAGQAGQGCWRVYYDDPSTTGNLTEQRAWDSTKGALARPLSVGTYVSGVNQYDAYGNRTLTTDARGVKTQYAYGQVGSFTDLYPTEIKAALGTTVQRTTDQEYDISTGLVTRSTDVDNNVYATTTYDVFGRPTLVKSGLRDGQVLPEETHTATVYSDVERRVIIRSDLNTKDDGKLVTVQHYDQLGRVRLSRKLEDASTQSETDETAGIKVQTRYAYSGSNSYVLTSNPYRAATSSTASGEATMGWTLSTVDQGGRVIRVEAFGGTALPVPFDTLAPNTNSSGAVVTSYDAEKATITDQAGAARQNIVDGLGRLAQVVEAPGIEDYLTSYTYDALGNLIQVAQGGQRRTFNYSSLSRLTSAMNPESGTTQYQYDAGGNLVLKLDPRPKTGTVTLPDCSIPYAGNQIATCYEYDELNRLKSHTYNDGTPKVTYTYDTAANGKGRLASLSSSVSTYSYAAYDALGRVTFSSQVTDGVTYSMPDYRYNLAGALVSEKYPSGRVVKTEYDMAGRVAGVQNQSTGLYYAGAVATDSANHIQYTSSDAPSAVKLGNGLWEHTSFNSRLQPTQIGLGTSATNSSTLQLDYAYGTDDAHNNGNVRSQTITVPGATAFVQAYSYDELNRLKSAGETVGATPNWNQTYSYDQFGNRNAQLDPATGLPVDPVGNPVIDPANNRIKSTVAGQENYYYDAAGNLTRILAKDRPYHDLAYDAENRQVSADGGAGAGGADYSYDGDGRRIKKVSGAATTIFVYDVAGRMVAEYSNNQPQAGGTSYVTADMLGSTRVVTGQDQGVKGRHDYLPFGEEIPTDNSWRNAAHEYGSSDGVRQKFTEKERDIETGLDYFGARYYSSTQGRFASVDPENAGATETKPQSWNGYSYSLNNPLRYVDPDGLRYAMIVLGNVRYYAWYDDEKKDANGQTEYDRALASGWSAVNFDESKPFSFTNGTFAPGETLTTTTLNPDGSHSVSFHTVTWSEWSALLAVIHISRLDGIDDNGLEAELLNKFLSSILGKNNHTFDPSHLPVPAPEVAGTQSDKLSKKADDLISGSLKRSPSYRSELGQKTYQEIIDLAKQGGAEGKAAQGMKKLIEQAERLREKVRGK